MHFIEMSGKTLKRIVSEDEFQAIELGQIGVTDESMIRVNRQGDIEIRRHSDVGRDRRPAGRLRPSRAPGNGPRLGRLLRLRTGRRRPGQVISIVTAGWPPRQARRRTG